MLLFLITFWMERFYAVYVWIFSLRSDYFWLITLCPLWPHDFSRLKSMPRAELIPEKPAPEKIKVIQQNLQKALLSFFDKIVPPEHQRAEKNLDIFPVHEAIELPVGQVAGSDVADESGISAQIVGVGNQAGFEQLFANAGPRIGSDALDIGEVNPESPGSPEDLPDILAVVIGIADYESSHDTDFMSAQPANGKLGFLPDVPFLKQLEVSRLHGLNPEENHAEVGPRQRRDQFRVADNTGDRRLDQVFHAVQAMFDDGFGEPPEAG